MQPFQKREVNSAPSSQLLLTHDEASHAHLHHPVEKRDPYVHCEREKEQVDRPQDHHGHDLICEVRRGFDSTK
jgi:hypothetical protein